MSKKAKKISLDLSSFDQNSHGFLNKPGEESGQDKVVKKVVTVKITKPKISSMK